MENAYHKALALADAELSPAELPALIDELARNPSMVRALQVYMTVGRGRLAKTYEAKRAEPVPQWLIDTVMQAPVEQSAGQSSKVVSYGNALLERMRRRYRMPGWSLAAGPAFAAVLAAVSAWLLVPSSRHGETLLAAQLQRAIETTRNREDATLLTFRPVMTFQDKDQGFCRQFEIRSGSERSGVFACRTQNGTWDIVMQTPPAPLATGPAGAQTELNLAVTQRRMGPPLEADEVAKLTGNGWRRN